MKTEIRAAREEDAPFLAWVMQEAARSHLEIGVWDVLFPGAEDARLDILARLARTGRPHYAHYSRFLIAQVDDSPAAALSGYESAAFGQTKIVEGLLEVGQQLDWQPAKLGELTERLSPYESLGYPNPEGVWIVEWVATRPERRGRGLIRELLVAILEEGRKQDVTGAQIGHLLGNLPAKSASEGARVPDGDDSRSAAGQARSSPRGVAAAGGPCDF